MHEKQHVIMYPAAAWRR